MLSSSSFQTKLRNSVRFIRDGGWLLHDRLYPLPCPSPEVNKAVIVRLDAIGDYMLFRPALRALREAPLMRGKQVTLCGNRAWQSLAEELDRDCFDYFFPVDRKKIIRSPAYRQSILRALRTEGFSLALHPTFSRDFISDTLIYASGASQRIGFASLPQNLSPAIKQITDHWYTTLVPETSPYPFELERNREFLHHLGISDTNIPPLQNALSQGLKDRTRDAIRALSGHPIFFLGGQARHRRWPIENYAALINYLTEKTGKPVLLTGGIDCSDEAKNLQTQHPEQTIDLTGQTSLPELAVLIAQSCILVSNDSAAVHIGATYKTPTLVIWNAQHAGRFHPYPREIAPNIRTLYPQSVNLNEDFLRRHYHTLSPHSVREVTVQQAKSALRTML